MENRVRPSVHISQFGQFDACRLLKNDILAHISSILTIYARLRVADDFDVGVRLNVTCTAAARFAAVGPFGVLVRVCDTQRFGIKVAERVCIRNYFVDCLLLLLLLLLLFVFVFVFVLLLLYYLWFFGITILAT